MSFSSRGEAMIRMKSPVPDRTIHREETSGGITFFRSAARGLHMPARLTPQPAKHEARKRRASERPRVGCCEELGRGCGCGIRDCKIYDQTKQEWLQVCEQRFISLVRADPNQTMRS